MPAELGASLTTLPRQPKPHYSLLQSTSPRSHSHTAPDVAYCHAVLGAADGEGVIYALSEQAANADMGTKCGGGDDDLVLLNGQEEPTEVC